MRIVVATPYKIANYGAILQAWAMRRVLEQFGHQVKFLNCRYLWPGEWRVRDLLMSRSIKSFRSKLKANSMIRRSFESMGGCPETREYNSIRELEANPPTADCYLAGSDQIYGENYFSSRRSYLPILLGFGAESIRRITYAASFGSNTVTGLPRSAEVSRLIRRQSFVGIRERSGVELLEKWIGIKGCWTPDPTFLLTKDEYFKSFAVQRREKNDAYICIYMLGWEGREHQLQELCRKTSEDLGIRNFFQIQGQLTVPEWLTVIANAACLITNSYHGLCFSRIFGVDCRPLFFEEGQEWRNERSRDLLQVLQTYSVEDIGILGRRILKMNLG